MERTLIDSKKADKMEISKIENSKNCIWWKFENIEFYWEIRTGEVLIKGENIETKLTFSQAETANAAGARKAIKQWLSASFGV